MNTATIILNIGLAAGVSILVATSMVVVPNLDRIRSLGRRHLASSAVPEQQAAYAATRRGEPSTAA